MKSWINQTVSEKAVYAASRRGWIDSVIFYNWFKRYLYREKVSLEALKVGKSIENAINKKRKRICGAEIITTQEYRKHQIQESLNCFHRRRYYYWVKQDFVRMEQEFCNFHVFNTCGNNETIKGYLNGIIHYRIIRPLSRKCLSPTIRVINKYYVTSFSYSTWGTDNLTVCSLVKIPLAFLVSTEDTARLC